jgi:hypothetical protein
MSCGGSDSCAESRYLSYFRVQGRTWVGALAEQRFTSNLALVWLGSLPSALPLGRASPHFILLIAAFFTPLRRRIQLFIDRRFYRSKYDARKMLKTFSAKLRDETDLDALSDDLVGVVRDTMQPVYVSLWMPPGRAPNDEHTG